MIDLDKDKKKKVRNIKKSKWGGIPLSGWTDMQLVYMQSRQPEWWWNRMTILDTLWLCIWRMWIRQDVENSYVTLKECVFRCCEGQLWRYSNVGAFSLWWDPDVVNVISILKNILHEVSMNESQNIIMMTLITDRNDQGSYTVNVRAKCRYQYRPTFNLVFLWHVCSLSSYKHIQTGL